MRLFRQTVSCSELALLLLRQLNAAFDELFPARRRFICAHAKGSEMTSRWGSFLLATMIRWRLVRQAGADSLALIRRQRGRRDRTSLV